MNTQDGQVAGHSGIALPTTVFSRGIDRMVQGVGEASSLLWTLLVMTIVLQVLLRYGFGIGSIMLEETQWHIYAIGFMLGLSFTELHERHVRIDVMAAGFNSRTRLWIELLGTSCFLLAFSLLVIWFSVPFAWSSWELGEISAAPDGLPYRWVLKVFMVTAFVLLALTATSRLTRIWKALFASH